MDRIATFKAFAEKRPDDPFPLYSLAMEYKNLGQYERAQEYFDVLQERFPQYVPAYFHAGANLVALERKSDAAARYKAGIEVAVRSRDAHAKDELEGALAQLESQSQ
jgi:tetratricopeptide (TPR) repeat protein